MYVTFCHQHIVAPKGASHFIITIFPLSCTFHLPVSPYVLQSHLFIVAYYKCQESVFELQDTIWSNQELCTQLMCTHTYSLTHSKRRVGGGTDTMFKGIALARQKKSCHANKA